MASASPSPSAVSPSTSDLAADDADAGISYEERRRLRLAQNREQLMMLGLYNAETPSAPPRKKVATMSRKKPSMDPATLRRSSRLVPGGSSDKELIALSNDDDDFPKAKNRSVSKAEDKNQEEEEEEELVYEASALATFDCYASTSKGGSAPTAKGALQFTGTSRIDNDLKRSFALQFHPTRPLLAAGGHQGHAAVFQVSTAQDESDSHLSWRAHNRWLSSVIWCEDNNLLLTSADDGAVAMWDTKQECRRAPRLVSRNVNLHKGAGIFDMAIHGRRIFSCSKDATISLANVTESAIVQTSIWEDAHIGVIKSIAARQDNSDVFASCGNDLIARVWDTRQATPVAFLYSTQGKALNSVIWHPLNSNQMVVSGFSNAMELWDVRSSPDKPLGRITGHFPSGVSTGKNICKPLFISNGSLLLASGGGSRDMTLFDATNDMKTIVARGYLGFEATCFGACAVTNRVAVAHNKEISLFE